MTQDDSPVVHIVDDDVSVRTALARFLQAAGFRTQSYPSAAEFLVAARSEDGGCVVLDIALPGMGGIELQAAIAKMGSTLPIVFLTGHGNIETSVRAMKAGAVDFLTKPVKRDALLAAVSAALSAQARERERRDGSRALSRRFETLTPREREVFSRVVDGKLNKQIADELGTSIRTVKAHRARVMEKMQAGSVAELVHAAHKLQAMNIVESGER